MVAIYRLQYRAEREEHEHAVVLPADVTQFLGYFRAKPKQGRQIVAKLIDQKARFLAPRRGRERSSIIPTQLEEIDKFLGNRFDLAYQVIYPDSINPVVLEETYLGGGVITELDAIVYLRKMREFRKKTLGKLATETGISGSVLSRLESGMHGRTKFSDIVRLERALDADGKLLGMFWNAASLHQMIKNQHSSSPELKSPYANWKINEYELAVLFIIACRRMQHEFPDQPIWLNQIRRKMG